MLSLQIADPALGWQLRKDLFNRMNMSVPSTPGQKVLFWLRVKRKSRGILNQAAMLAVAAKYNLSYTYALEIPFALVFVPLLLNVWFNCAWIAYRYHAHDYYQQARPVYVSLWLYLPA